METWAVEVGAVSLQEAPAGGRSGRMGLRHQRDGISMDFFRGNVDDLDEI